MSCDDIAALFASYRKGREFADNWKDEILQPLEKEEWLERLAAHSRKLNDLYEENAQLIKNVLSPICADPDSLTGEEFDCLYYWLHDMYVNDYDDPYTLHTIGDILVNHYEKTDDLDRYIFSCQCAGYAALEMSRSGNRQAGRHSVAMYRRILAHKKDFGKFKNPKTSESIFVAYSNLIRTEYTLNNMTVLQAYKVWKNFIRFRKQKKSHIYDEMQPRIGSLIEYFDSDFRAYGADTYYEAMECLSGQRMRANFNEKAYKEMLDISLEYLSALDADPDEPMLLTPDLYCNYQRLLVYSGRLSWEEAFARMNSFYERSMSTSHDVDDDMLIDPVATVTNPIRRMMSVMKNVSSLSKEQCEEYCKRYYRYAINFFRNNHVPEYTVSVNEAVAAFLFSDSFMRAMTSGKRKEEMIFEFIICSHPITYIHSLMVSKAVAIMMEKIFECCPETLVGLPRMRTVSDVLRNRDEIRRFAIKSALFHDIGKNSIIDIINTEHRKISDDEFNAIRCHPGRAIEYLSSDPSLRRYRDIAIGHHKFYNGKGGYPASFDNTKSRYRAIIDLVTICDCLDAATDFLGRNFRRAKDLPRMLDEFRSGAGTRYNPVYVELLCTNQQLQAELADLISNERRDVYYEVYSKFFTYDTDTNATVMTEEDADAFWHGDSLSADISDVATEKSDD